MRGKWALHKKLTQVELHSLKREAFGDIGMFVAPYLGQRPLASRRAAVEEKNKYGQQEVARMHERRSDKIHPPWPARSGQPREFAGKKIAGRRKAPVGLVVFETVGGALRRD